MSCRNKNQFLPTFFLRFLSLSAIVIFCGNVPVLAQNNTSSPYSYFGLGELNDGGNGQSLSRGGTNLAFRNGDNINIDNPASLAGIDSLKFIFNLGFSSKFTKMNQNGKSDNFYDNNISQVGFGFRISPIVSTAITIRPYTNVGYEISSREKVNGSNSEYFIRTLTGNGGLNQFIWSNGFAISENLYLGANAIFLFGNNTSDEILVLENNSYVYSSQKQLISQGVYGNFGLQFHNNIGREWGMSVGAILQPKFGVSSKRKIYVTNYQSSVGDTVYKNTLDRGEFDVPMTYGLGIGLTKKKRMWIGADYLCEKWSDTKIFKENNEFVDRNKFSFGFNYIANDGYATKFLKKLTYRFGAFYDSGYLKIASDRINKKGITFGIGLPMAREKGVVNLSFEFGQMGTTTNDNVREDYGKITVEMSLFERWFVKRKYN